MPCQAGIGPWGIGQMNLTILCRAQFEKHSISSTTVLLPLCLTAILTMYADVAFEMLLYVAYMLI